MNIWKLSGLQLQGFAFFWVIKIDCNLMILKKIDQSILDIEDLKKKQKIRSSNLPLFVEINLYNNGKFCTENEIETQLRKITISYPKDIRVVLL